MADPNNLAQFKYAAMSNLVLQADRRFVSRRTEENTGDPESLAGRINIGDMGSRVGRGQSSRPTRGRNATTLQRGAAGEGADVLQREQRRRTRGLQQPNVSLADLNVEDLRYRPTTAANRSTYDLITTVISRLLGEVPAQVTVSAVDAVLEVLKNEETKDYDKKKEIQDILGPSTSMASKDYSDLVNLSKKITDYDNQDEEETKRNQLGEGEDPNTDERQGVAVEFDDEDDDEDEDGIARGTFVRDLDEDDDEEDFPVNDNDDADENEEAEDSERLDDAGEMILSTEQSEAVPQQDKAGQIIPAHEIDAFWLQRQIGTVFPDAHMQQENTHKALEFLKNESEAGKSETLRDLENNLMELFDYEHTDLIKKLVQNRDKILWVTRWRRVAEDPQARKALEQEMIEHGQAAILREIQNRDQAGTGKQVPVGVRDDPMEIDRPEAPKDIKMTDVDETAVARPKRIPQTVNLTNYIFDQGSHLMTNQQVKLPPGSTKENFPGYQQVTVPQPKPTPRKPNEPKNMPTSDLPDWARQGFGSSKELNRIQTRCFDAAFNHDGNMLICAPTGSGKTNVAMLAILREIGKHRNPETGEIYLDDFKIVYISPLKALVQEQVGNLGARLATYGIKVAELTGDRTLTKQQITDTQVIISTPEKWDVITRKSNDLSYTKLVRLICIDEIHLLHDERGPVVESIVSRTLRSIDRNGDPVRLIGLSATLPNYRDVGNFLRADPNTGVFHFDGSFRPCPLRQEFIGLTDKKPIKQLKVMNDVCYKKVLEQVGEKRNQMLIFTHSRKDTAKTAKFIRDKALEEDTVAKLVSSDAATKELLLSESSQVANADLKDIMQYGFGIHHAGLSRSDRNSVEDLFAEGYLRVIFCTATLAWGVNLPAHTVVIKGTQIYSPEKGSWTEISPQDILQMLGRAGRPQFDTFGEGIVITTHAEMQFYLSLMNQQLPIESQFMTRLADALNAEIVLGDVRNLDDGVDWLSYTYLFIRMLRSPGLYQVGADYEDDDSLEQKRLDLIHSAALILDKEGLIRYDKKDGKLQSKDLGRIASHYYINHTSIETYNRNLQINLYQWELFQIFSQSDEFKYIPVRNDERLEVQKLLNLVPIPVKETAENPVAKINVLLQAYISRIGFEGLAMMTDLCYVTENVSRLCRAMFEICLRRGLGTMIEKMLRFCLEVERRQWAVWSPLRQFPDRPDGEDTPYVPAEVIKKHESMFGILWEHFYELDPPRMGELLEMPKAGRIVCNAVAHFPRVDIQCQVVPITRSTLRMEITLTPNFKWNDKLHGASQLFWLFVKDLDGEVMLYYDTFLLKKEYAEGENNGHLFEFTVPIIEPFPPCCYIRVYSDKWIKAMTKLTVYLEPMKLPEKFPPPTPLLDLQPLPTTALKREEFSKLYQNWSQFNRIQTQTFNSLFTTDDNVFVGAPTGSGKTACAEFALLRHWSKADGTKAVYSAPFQEIVDMRLAQWQKRLGGLMGGQQIEKLTGETAADIRILARADLVLATPIQWDVLSRQWRRRKPVQDVHLFIADELHMIGGFGGYTYEIIVSRMRTIKAQLESPLRIVGLSVSVAQGRDMGEWFGCTGRNIFNFSPQVRPTPLDLHLQPFTNTHFPSLMIQMAKPLYYSILELSPKKPAIVFVPNRKQTRSTAIDLLGQCASEDDEDRFLNTDIAELQPVLEQINEKALANALAHGVGYYHEALTSFDKQVVQQLFDLGAIQVMLVSRECAWEVQSTAYLVVIMGTQYFEGREHRYIDYPVSEVLQMFGKTGRPGIDKSGKGVLMTLMNKREHYKKFLNESLPVESQLHHYLSEWFVTDISTRMISTTQDAISAATYTYFYPRLLANPNYYDLHDTSNEGLSVFLTEQIEKTLEELQKAGTIEYDEDEGTITPLNPGMIAAYYNISFVTMQTFLLSLTRSTKMKGLLEIITAASEFEEVPIRRHEQHILRRIYDRVPVKMANANYESPQFKTFILLQAHFSRMYLPVDLLKDQETILRRVLTLLSAAVDILGSEGHLNALNAMEMSQMVVQAVWDRASPLLQIPHFTEDTVAAATAAGIDDIASFAAAMDPDENADYAALVASLRLTPPQLAAAAAFTNTRYPDVSMDVAPEDPTSLVAGEEAFVSLTLERDEDEPADADAPQTPVHAPFFPERKAESWWVLVADEKRKNLLALRRITLAKNRTVVRLGYTVPEAGKHELTVYLMSDCYVGVDLAPKFEVEVAEAEEDDEDEDEEMEG